jgi:hypothetical protein
LVDVRLDTDNVTFPLPTHRAQTTIKELKAAKSFCAAPGDPPRTLGLGCAAQNSSDVIVVGSALFGADAEMKLSWSINCTNQTIEFTIDVDDSIKGWFGFG